MSPHLPTHHLALAWVASLALVAACTADTQGQDAEPAPDDRPVASSTSATDQPVTLAFLNDPSDQVHEVSLSVPPGFHDSAQDGDVATGELGWYVVSDDQREFLGFFALPRIYRDACRTDERQRLDPGPSVRDLVDGLSAQKGSQVTERHPVTLAGYGGTYIELRGPSDLTRCHRPALAPTRGIFGDGQVDRMWVLDVDGQRLVVDASHSGAQSSPADVAMVTAMVESLSLASS